MDTTVAAQIEKRLAELPEDVRAAVMSVEWEEKVRQIAGKHALHIDQTGALGDTTLMAMLGFFDMADFPVHLTEELKIPTDQAAAIGGEITAEVFRPIRESLKKFTEGNKATIPAPTAPKPDLVAAEAMLQAKTVSAPAPAVPAQPVVPQKTVPTAAPVMPPIAKQEPPKPGAYAADPYREPPL